MNKTLSAYALTASKIAYKLAIETQTNVQSKPQKEYKPFSPK